MAGNYDVTAGATGIAAAASFSLTNQNLATNLGISAPTLTYGNTGVVTVTVSSGTGTPTGNVTLSVNGTTPIMQSLSGGSSTFDFVGIGAGNYSLSASYAAQGVYLGSSNTGALLVNKASPLIGVTDANGTYNGSAFAATATVAGVVNGVDSTPASSLENVTPTLAYYVGNTAAGTSTSTAPIQAGTYTVQAYFPGSADYGSGYSNAVTFTIGQASAMIAITPYSVTYDANSHTATGTATGVAGIDLSADLTLGGTIHTNAGTYNGDAWTFHDAAGNYADANGTVNDAIGQASASITVTPYSVTYDANPHTATATATGVAGVNLIAGLTLSGTIHTSAGTYNGDAWTFHDAAGNYADANGTVNDAIGQASASITVTPYSVTYDANPHTATAIATGVGGVNLIAGLTLSGTIHTNAGTYNGDGWTFHDAAGNYADANGTVNDAIGQANAAITVTPYSVTYDANPHTATATATGVAGVNLAAGLTLSGTIHTNAGTYNGDAWSFHDAAGNYADANGTVNDAIGQATASITVTPYSVTYDANPHTATATATGVGGFTLIAGLTLSGTTHTNAGTYNGDGWTFHDAAGNYADANGTVNDAIGQASASITVTPYSVTYDANPHTATATATGVAGVNLIADLTLSGTIHTDAGTYTGDGWTFHDATGNYADANGTVNDSIGQANAAITVTPYSVTYDANPHTATATATGIGGFNLIADVTLGATTHTNAGTYNGDAWTFHDATGNYADAHGTVNDAIGQALASITITPYGVTYDANSHTATGTATGVGGVNLAAGLTLGGTIHTNAGTYNGDAWTFHDAAGNYADANGTVNDVIAKASPSVSVTDGGGVYNGLPFPATGSVTGVGGTVLGTPSFNYYLASDTTFANASTNAPVNVGGYVVVGSFTTTANYAAASGKVSFAITGASPHIIVTGASAFYDGNPHAATGTATGVESPAPVNLTSLLHLSYKNLANNAVSALAPVSAGTYEVLASFTGNANYPAEGTFDTGQKVVIKPAVTLFSGLGNVTMSYHDKWFIVTGKITASGLVPPGNVTVKLNGVQQVAAIASNGTFYTAFKTATLAPGAYAVQYAYAGSSNFAPVSTTTTLNVVYVVKPLNPAITYKAGLTIPLQILISDALSQDVNTTNTVVTATGLALASSPTKLLPFSTGNRPATIFNPDNDGDEFTLNLRTTGLAAGQYVLYFQITGDPATHSILFTIGK